MGGVIDDDDMEKMRGKMRKSINNFRANLVPAGRQRTPAS